MTRAVPRFSRQPPRRASLIVLGLGALIATVLASGWRPLTPDAQLAVAFGARTACSCRHVSNRSLDDCQKDLGPGMGLVWLSEEESDRSVTASVPLLASETATYRRGWGCMLEPLHE